MAINLQEVNFAYKNKKKKLPPRYILKDINLSIDSNDEFIALVGESGAGKSTLVQLFNALLLSTSGEVKVFDKVISEKSKIKKKDVRKKVGLVFQFPEYQLFDDTVLKDVSYGPKNFGLDNPTELAKEALSVVGISESLYDRNPLTLSGGQMRKVAIAGILASNPDILVFDEPTVGLDPVSRNELLELLEKINKEYHKSIILITHDMDVVGKSCKRVIVLKQGKIVFDDKKDELFKNKELMSLYSIDYPTTVKMLLEIKNKLNVDLNVLQYTVIDAYKELARVLGCEE